jgi:phosphoglycolate phosphatase-like HAD superfamily hydrolase
MEILNSFVHGRVRVAVFDFDGTLSVLRREWTHIMHDLMIEALLATPRHEGEPELSRYITNFIYSTSGQQTIYQMIHLTEQVAQRGGTPLSAPRYFEIFTERLLTQVNERIAAIRSGMVAKEDWLVPGSLSFLQLLRAQNIPCYIASGTGEKFVRDEAALLGIAPFFIDIHGAHADYKNHSKKIVINNLVQKYQLHEGELVTFGDGKPEMVDTKSAGGIAVGLATDEEKRQGINERKRQVLIDAGADMIIPDFSGYAEWSALLFSN